MLNRSEGKANPAIWSQTLPLLSILFPVPVYGSWHFQLNSRNSWTSSLLILCGDGEEKPCVSEILLNFNGSAHRPVACTNCTSALFGQKKSLSWTTFGENMCAHARMCDFGTLHSSNYDPDNVVIITAVWKRCGQQNTMLKKALSLIVHMETDFTSGMFSGCTP